MGIGILYHQGFTKVLGTEELRLQVLSCYQEGGSVQLAKTSWLLFPSYPQPSDPGFRVA